MRWRHFIWNSSCNHIFRVDQLLLDKSIFFLPSPLLESDHRSITAWTQKQNMEQQQKACVCLRYTWLSKAIASAYWDAYMVLANSWLHHCCYTECSCPEKTRFMISYFLLLLNQDPATAIQACVTFRSDFLPWKLQKDQDENCGWFIMLRFSCSEVNTKSISHWSSVVCISLPQLQNWVRILVF